jgi:hypothetical protein
MSIQHKNGTNVAIFWDIALCRPYGNQHLGRTYHHLQSRKSAEQQVVGEHIYDKTENYFNFFISYIWKEALRSKQHTPYCTHTDTHTCKYIHHICQLATITAHPCAAVVFHPGMPTAVQGQ